MQEKDRFDIIVANPSYETNRLTGGSSAATIFAPSAVVRVPVVVSVRARSGREWQAVLAAAAFAKAPA